MKTTADSFVLDLAAHLRALPLPTDILTEHDLERSVAAAVRDFVQKRLKVTPRQMDGVVCAHGDTRETKALWTSSKRMQNVVAYGCSNTGDIFITHPQVGAVYVELKLSKARGPKSNSLPGDLQRSIGQSLIASLRHPFVICLVATQGRRKDRDNDLAESLRRTLWDKHRIALIVRGIVPGGAAQ